ncbi:MAG: cupin domain-containing protein [Alphaproteobacteria bacterium]
MSQPPAVTLGPAGDALSAEEIIRILGLEPHPEGGHYRETFRDGVGVGVRAASTAIYFLLRAQERSHWHRVDAAEMWHWYAGAPLALGIADRDDAAPDWVTVSPDLVAGHRPQAVVPAGAWQSARSLGAYTLVGCTVAPGFLFSGFELAPDGWAPGGPA